MRDIKKHTSTALRDAIKNLPGDGRWELMLWMVERAGNDNIKNQNFQSWQHDNYPFKLPNSNRFCLAFDLPKMSLT